MNDLHCPGSFVKSIAPLNVSPIDSMSYFTLPIHGTLGLPLFLFPSNLACSALYEFRSTVILSTCPNNPSLRWPTLSSRVIWLPNACLIIFSPCFSIVRHFDPQRKTGCIVVWYDYFYPAFLS